MPRASGCGCAATVFAGHIYQEIMKNNLKNFCYSSCCGVLQDTTGETIHQAHIVASILL